MTRTRKLAEGVLSVTRAFFPLGTLFRNKLKMMKLIFVLVTAGAFQVPHQPLATRTRLRQGKEVVFEDAASFAFEDETFKSWATFGGAVSVVLGGLDIFWIRGDTGYCDDFLNTVSEAVGNEPHLTTLALGVIFAVTHSGLAALRPTAEDVIGPRAFRVLFALASLPLAYAWIVFFLVHRYDGFEMLHLPLRSHGFLFFVNLISFFFLYPSTFNLKEVAAVDKPELHLWGTGVIRITRHPQAFGQFLWSAAHGAAIGTSVTWTTMALLVAHHAFSIWHGDTRLQAKYGPAFDALQNQTSVVPFAAILDGRQLLPSDYWREWLRLPYLVILVATLGAYFAHPYMQAFAASIQSTPLQPGGLLG